MRLLCPIAAAVNSVHHAGLAVGKLPTAMTIIALEAIVVRKAAIQNRRRGILKSPVMDRRTDVLPLALLDEIAFLSGGRQTKKRRRVIQLTGVRVGSLNSERNYFASSASMTLTTSAASGFVFVANRPTTAPSLLTTNFSKFHFTSSLLSACAFRKV